MAGKKQNILILTFAAVFIAIFSAGAQDKRDIGGFDIDKVREFSSKQETAPPAISAESEKSAVRKAPQNYTLVILRIIGSLGIIIALILGLLWLLKKAGLAGTARRGGGGGSMDVLEAVSLGPNRNVVLVRVRDMVYVCGSTVSSVTLLDKLDGAKATELLASEKGPSTVVQFKDAFNQFLSKVKK
ncbi:MAG: flagellar biosynthetic protein FliO [Chitinispirillaceae bacterium]|jgi:flagellar biosynthetic protein FliO|nr:flagellar biosynthetic protein FliO [Chitinispirillaceae bacterium]